MQTAIRFQGSNLSMNRESIDFKDHIIAGVALGRPALNHFLNRRKGPSLKSLWLNDVLSLRHDTFDESLPP